MPNTLPYGTRCASRRVIAFRVLAGTVVLFAVAIGLFVAVDVWKHRSEQRNQMIEVETHRRLLGLAETVNSILLAHDVRLASQVTGIDWQTELFLRSNERGQHPYQLHLFFDTGKNPRLRIKDLVPLTGRQYWYWEGEVMFRRDRDDDPLPQDAVIVNVTF